MRNNKEEIELRKLKDKLHSILKEDIPKLEKRIKELKNNIKEE